MITSNLDTAAEREAAAAAFERADFETARACWLRGAEAGDVEALVELGLMHSNGRGAERDHVAAKPYFEQAAERGHPEAEYCLGVLFNAGLGVEDDAAEAAYWYTRAAEKGHALAQCNLAILYEKGLYQSALIRTHAPIYAARWT